MADTDARLKSGAGVFTAADPLIPSPAAADDDVDEEEPLPAECHSGVTGMESNRK